jgi:hypothetical protein
MAQIFHPSFKVISRASIIVAVIVFATIGYVAAEMYRSGYMTNQGVPREQPVPFSHEHHYNGLGIQCGYCHTTAEQSSFAGIPPTHTCMTCHSQIWTNAPMLQPVRTSYQTGTSLEWVRVHDLPDFVYFSHKIHVAKGIACQVCHGDVNVMPLVRRTQSLQMRWCLECHRAPEKFIRPKSEVYNFDYKPTVDQETTGVKLVREYDVKTAQLTDCSICHR